jgi:hypothetical protein
MHKDDGGTLMGLHEAGSSNQRKISDGSLPISSDMSPAMKVKGRDDTKHQSQSCHHCWHHHPSESLEVESYHVLEDHTEQTGTCAKRVALYNYTAFAGQQYNKDGLEVEGFGGPDNLMMWGSHIDSGYGQISTNVYKACVDAVNYIKNNF